MERVDKIKVGFVPISKFIFNQEETRRYKRLIQDKLDAWNIDYVSIDKVTKDGLIHRMEDIDPVVDCLKQQRIEAVFAPHCNFGTEGLVGLLGRKLDLPFLLWGPQDDPPLPDGSRTRDTLCGILASSKVLGKLGVPFTYIENCPVDDRAFEEGFEKFLRVAAMVHAQKNLRIGQIGPRVDFFYTTIVNESVLLEKYNVEIIPTDLAQIIAATKNRALADAAGYQDEAKALKQDFDLEGFTDDQQLYLLFLNRLGK